MPPWIEFAVTHDTNAPYTLPKFPQMFERRFHLAFTPHDANAVLHNLLQILLHLIRIFTAALLEWCESFTRCDIDLRIVDIAQRIFFGEFCSKFSRTFSKY